MSRRPCIRHHRLTFQSTRLFLEAICAQTFVTHVQRLAGSRDANDDADDHADDHADDPVTFMKTARMLRGRTRPQQVKLANDFKGMDLSAHLNRLSSVAETVRQTRGKATIPTKDLGSRLSDFDAPSIPP